MFSNLLLEFQATKRRASAMKNNQIISNRTYIKTFRFFYNNLPSGFKEEILRGEFVRFRRLSE